MSAITLSFPDEWNPDLAPPIDVWPPTEYRHEESGDYIVLSGVLLADGTNLLGVWWSTGKRVARTTAAIDWAIEERFEGELPDHLADAVEHFWRIVINAQVKAAKETRAEMADPKCVVCDREVELPDAGFILDAGLVCEGCVDRLADELVVVPFTKRTYRRKAPA